jgi:hypothetical protein
MIISTKHAAAIRHGILLARHVIDEAREFPGDVVAVDPSGVAGYAFRRSLGRQAFGVGRFLRFEGRFVRLVRAHRWPGR